MSQRVFTRTKKVLADVNYWDQLTGAQANWLYQFAREYHCADGLNANDAIHKTAEERSLCYRNNNKTNRDALSKVLVEVDGDLILAANYTEDAVIRSLDLHYQDQREKQLTKDVNNLKRRTRYAEKKKLKV